MTSATPLTHPVVAAVPRAVSALDIASAPSRVSPVAGADLSPFGVVVPVLAGSSGAGASVFAAAAVDALQRAGRCTLLVDAAEPFRSGLSSATEVEGQHATSPAPGIRVRYSWRDHAVMASRETDLDPAVAAIPGLEPLQWLPLPPLEPLHTTVVDLGQDWTRPESCAPDGACGWLRTPTGRSSAPRPVLVVRATRPSLMAAEAALARLDTQVGAGQLVAPARLVVMASWKKRGWPAGVTGAAGARVARLLDDAVFVPYDRDLDLGGVTADPTPTRVQAVVAGLFDQWGLLTPTTA
jgi:hypothetical protein